MPYALSEFESKKLLADAGIPVPEERLVLDAESAVQAARELGYPVALKLCGRGISHKTEHGWVRLGLPDAESVRAQARDLLAQRQGEAGVLVSPTVAGQRELIAGLVRDPQFGPCVMLGLGGVFTEIIGDVAFAVAPLAPFDGEDLIDALTYSKLLGRVRGEPEVDRQKLIQLLERLGRIGLEQSRVCSIDIPRFSSFP